VQTSTINLSGADPELLKKALVALGFRLNDRQYAYNVPTGAQFSADRFTDSTSVVLEADGRVTVRASRLGQERVETLTREVKRAYSTEVVKAASARFGWKVQQSVNSKGQTQFKVQR
jgi:arylamine N-acetyltransferase